MSNSWKPKVDEPTWIAVPAKSKRDTWQPRVFLPKSVGSDTVHFGDHADMFMQYCYQTFNQCSDRCDVLRYIATGQVPSV